MRYQFLRHCWTCGLVLLAIAGCNPPSPGTEGSPSYDPQEWTDHTLDVPFTFGYQEGLAKAKSEGKPAMLFVTTTWCGFCRKLAHENFNDPAIKEILSNQLVCVLVDGDTEKGVTRSLGVRGFPHIIFLNANGENLGEFSGAIPPTQFKIVLDTVLGAVPANS